MKSNFTINELLKYRFQTNLLIDLLESSSYFDFDVSLERASVILEKAVKNQKLICENKLPVPRSLLKKNLLSEAGPPEIPKFNPRIQDTARWLKGVEMAKEAEAAKAAAEAAAAQAKLEASAKEATSPLEVGFPIAAKTKGITPLEQEGLGKEIAKILSAEALKKVGTKQYASPEELAKELKDEMTVRFLQAGKETDPRIAELQAKLGGYVDLISPAAFDLSGTLKYGTVPPPQSFARDILLKPEFGTPRPEVSYGKYERGTIAGELKDVRQEIVDTNKALEAAKQDAARREEAAKTLLKLYPEKITQEGPAEPIRHQTGFSTGSYTREPLESPEKTEEALKALVAKIDPEAVKGAKEAKDYYDILRSAYFREKMAGKVTTPEEKAAGEAVRSAAQAEIQKAETPRLPSPEQVPVRRISSSVTGEFEAPTSTKLEAPTSTKFKPKISQRSEAPIEAGPTEIETQMQGAELEEFLRKINPSMAELVKGLRIRAKASPEAKVSPKKPESFPGEKELGSEEMMKQLDMS